MILVVVGLLIGIIVTGRLANHITRDGTLAGTLVGLAGMLAGALSGAALGFVASTLLGVVLPMRKQITVSRVQPLTQSGIFVQKGTKDNGRYYRFLDSSGYTQTVPLVQTTFQHIPGPQLLTTTDYVFVHPWEKMVATSVTPSMYHFDLNRLEPTNVVTTAF